jgi:thermitase
MRRVAKAIVAGALVTGSLVSFGFSPPHGVDGPKASPKAAAASLPKYKNWGLINTQGRSHIHALDAWKIQEGSKKVVVAVIDTGIDASHKDLSANIWKAPSVGWAAAKKDTGVFGWNFVNDKANPTDDHGHGTHVAGIIGAVANPKNGVSGVAHHVSIMAVKYYSDSNTGAVNLRNTVKALNYAIDNGAKIINYSGGGPEPSEEEYVALKRAETQGILVVAAAGNERQNTDLPENKYYPAAYRLTNMISVAATDINNNLLSSSNWGKQRVDVAAPGDNIYSTLPGGRYGYMSGTSQATAFVSGLAALLLSQDPTLTPVQIREIIMGSVDRFPQLASKLATGGRVNAYAALLAAKNKSTFKATKQVVASREQSVAPPVFKGRNLGKVYAPILPPSTATAGASPASRP